MKLVVSRDHDETRLQLGKHFGNSNWWVKLIVSSVSFVAQIETEPYKGSEALLSVEIPFAHKLGVLCLKLTLVLDHSVPNV